MENKNMQELGKEIERAANEINRLTKRGPAFFLVKPGSALQQALVNLHHDNVMDEVINHDC